MKEPNRELHDRLQDYAAWQTEAKLLRSGPVVIAVLIVERLELGCLNGREIAALASVAPEPQAASRLGGRRASVCTISCMTTVTATRCFSSSMWCFGTRFPDGQTVCPRLVRLDFQHSC